MSALSLHSQWKGAQSRTAVAVLAVAVVAAIPVTYAEEQPVPRYRIVDLGSLGGLESEANDINDRGQIVGVSDDLIFVDSHDGGLKSNEATGFVIDPDPALSPVPSTWYEPAKGGSGNARMLSLGGIESRSRRPPTLRNSRAECINESGVIVGLAGVLQRSDRRSYFTMAGYSIVPADDAHRWTQIDAEGVNHRMTHLLGPNGGEVSPVDLNDAGQVLALQFLISRDRRSVSVHTLARPLTGTGPFEWSRVENRSRDWTFGQSLDQYGNVVGRCPNGQLDRYGRVMENAFFGRPGDPEGLIYLPRLGGTAAEANDVTQQGMAVGWSETDRHTGFRYERVPVSWNVPSTDLRPTRLPLPVGLVTQNSLGEVVGPLWVNERRQIIGRMTAVGLDHSSGANRDDMALLWDDANDDEQYAAGEVHSLSDLVPTGGGWDRLRPTAINNRGWIVGQGSFCRIDRAFLILPLDGAVPVCDLKVTAGPGTLHDPGGDTSVSVPFTVRNAGSEPVSDPQLNLTLRDDVRTVDVELDGRRTEDIRVGGFLPILLRELQPGETMQVTVTLHLVGSHVSRPVPPRPVPPPPVLPPPRPRPPQPESRAWVTALCDDLDLTNNSTPYSIDDAFPDLTGSWRVNVRATGSRWIFHGSLRVWNRGGAPSPACQVSVALNQGERRVRDLPPLAPGQVWAAPAFEFRRSARPRRGDSIQAWIDEGNNVYERREDNNDPHWVYGEHSAPE